jgi:SAM-dependent methyltransferase
MKETIQKIKQGLFPGSALDSLSFSEFRKPTWEEDISLHHDPAGSFENAPPPCEMPLEAFNVPSYVTEKLLNGRSLADYVARDQFPIPHARDREGYQVNHDARYFLNGLADFLWLESVASKYQLQLNSFLDFGCASGRVLRHFCSHTQLKHLWGCDINGRHIKWMNDYLPARLKMIHSHGLSHLPIASSSIDMISAFSVFTHIDTFESGWLSELHRILKPGGLVYLTVHNDATWKHLQSAQANATSHHLLNRLCQIEPKTSEMLRHDIPAERTVFRYADVGPYRALVFHSNAYLHRLWGRFFEVLEIVPMGHGNCQSVLVGRKRS